MKRIHSVAVLAVGVGLVLSACSSPSGRADQAETPPSKLTVLVTDSPSATLLKAAGADYTKKSGIEVEFVSVPNDQLPTKLVLSAKAKQATFDIAQFDALTMPTIVPAGALVGLDAYLDKDKDYNNADFPEALHTYGKYEDVSYGVPLSTEPYVNFYRKDLFQKAGLKVPSTWDQLDGQAKQFKDAGAYGYCGYYGPALSARAYTERLYASGGRVLDPDSNKPLLNTDFAKSVMRDFVGLAQYSPKSTYTSGQTGATTAFTQLGCAQMVAPSGWYGTLANPASSKVSGTFGVASPPLGSGGQFTPQHILYGWLVGISAQSPHQDAAWDFLSFALGQDSLDRFLKTGAPITGRTSWISDASLPSKLSYVSALPSGIAKGTVLPRIPELTEIMQKISETASGIQSGQLQLDPAMDKLNAEILAMLVSTGRVAK